MEKIASNPVTSVAVMVFSALKRAVLQRGGFGECRPGFWGPGEHPNVPLSWFFGTGETFECTLVPVCGTGEHPPKPPFCEPPKNVLRIISVWLRFRSVTVSEWNGSSVSSFRFQRFLWGRWVSVLQLPDRDCSVSAFGS